MEFLEGKEIGDNRPGAVSKPNHAESDAGIGRGGAVQAKDSSGQDEWQRKGGGVPEERPSVESGCEGRFHSGAWDQEVTEFGSRSKAGEILFYAPQCFLIASLACFGHYVHKQPPSDSGRQSWFPGFLWGFPQLNTH
jgi:hypothetical protein